MRTALVVVLSAAVVVGGIVIIRQATGLAALQRRHEQDAKTIDQLRAALHPQSSTSTVAVPPSQSGVPMRKYGTSEPQDTSLLAARDAEIQQLNGQLQSAHDEVARLQAQLQSAGQEKQEAVTSANDASQKHEQEMQDQITALQQQLDSAREDAKAAQDRASSLQADNTKLRNDNGASSQRIVALRKMMANLQDLNRRRDGYLNSMIRRYRDITEQFRSITGELDSNRGAGQASFDGVALSRIQNAISLTEDDLHRLSELNAQTRQLENKLAKN